MTKALSSLAAASAALMAYGQSVDPNQPIVTINGEKVLAGEYFNRMEFLNGVGTIMNGKFIEMPPAFLTLERIINEHFITQIAREKGVLPTPAEIEAEFKARKASSAAQFTKLTELGISDAEIKGQILVELAQFNLVTQGVKLTDQQVADHYNRNKMLYATPALVKLRVIVVKTAEDKAKVDQALKARLFSDVARELSVDLTKLDGGDLPQVSVGNVPKNLAPELVKTAPGATTAWIESEGAFLKYLVESKTDSKQLALDDKLKAEIRRQLMIREGAQKNNVKAMLDEKRRSAKIEIASPGLQKLWNNYIKDYLRSTGRGPGAG